MSNIPKKNPDAVNNFGIVLIGLTSAILLWVSVVALQAYYGSTAGAVEEERVAANQGREVRELKAMQVAALKEHHWVDARKGTLSIPIEDAEARVLEGIKAGAPSLVPAVGAHDTPTVPAMPGRPPDTVAAPGGAGAAAAVSTPAAATGAPGAAPGAPSAAPAAPTSAPSSVPAAPGSQMPAAVPTAPAAPKSTPGAPPPTPPAAANHPAVAPAPAPATPPAEGQPR